MKNDASVRKFAVEIEFQHVKLANVDIGDRILLQLLLEFSDQAPVERPQRINYK